MPIGRIRDGCETFIDVTHTLTHPRLARPGHRPAPPLGTIRPTRVICSARTSGSIESWPRAIARLTSRCIAVIASAARGGPAQPAFGYRVVDSLHPLACRSPAAHAQEEYRSAAR